MKNKHLSASAAMSIKSAAKAVGAKIDEAMDALDAALSPIDGASRTLDALSGGAEMILRKAVRLGQMPAGKIANFARSVQRLLSLPAKAVAAPTQILTTYRNLARDLTRQFKNDPVGAEKVKNQAALLKAVFAASVTASCRAMATACASADGAFKSRQEVVEAAEGLQDFFDEAKSYFEAQAAKNVFPDEGETYSAMLAAARAAAELLINASFSMKTRRIVRLGRDRQVVELVASLYGNLDRLDEFIVDNGLTAETLQVIPAGTEVAYYK